MGDRPEWPDPGMQNDSSASPLEVPVGELPPLAAQGVSLPEELPVREAEGRGAMSLRLGKEGKDIHPPSIPSSLQRALSESGGAPGPALPCLQGNESAG